jgi:hypothetical protein
MATLNDGSGAGGKVVTVRATLKAVDWREVRVVVLPGHSICNTPTITSIIEIKSKISCLQGP